MNHLPEILGANHYVNSCIQRYKNNDWIEYYTSLYQAFVKASNIDLAAELDEIYALSQGKYEEKRRYRIFMALKPNLYHLNELMLFNNKLWHPWGYPYEISSEIGIIYSKYRQDIDKDISILIKTCQNTMASLFMDHYNLNDFSFSLEELIKNGFSNKVPDEDDSWM